MTGYRDDRSAAWRRVDELEHELSTLRLSAPVVAPQPRGHAALSLLGGVTLVAVGVAHGIMVAWIAGASVVLASLHLAFSRRRSALPAEGTVQEGTTRRADLEGAAPVEAEALAGEGQFTLPLLVKLPSACADLEVEARVCRLDVHPASAFFTIAVALICTGHDEVDGIWVRVNLVDSSGETPHEARWSEVMKYSWDAPMRAGDVYVFDELLALDAFEELRAAGRGMTEAQLTLSVQVAPPRDHGRTVPVYVAMAVSLPDHIKLEFRERKREAIDGGEQLDLEVTNVGATEVATLHLSERYHRKDGSHYDESRLINQVTYRERPIPPGETRVVRLRAKLPKDIARWEPVVLSVE